jgi:hypothetical protein
MQPKENTLRAIHREGPEWVPNGYEAVVEVLPPLAERPKVAGPDAFGVDWTLDVAADGGTYPTQGGHTITDLCRWEEQLALPDVNALDWQGVAADVGRIDRQRFLVEAHVAMGLFERSYLLLGMEEALIGYITQPETMAAMLGAIAGYKIALIEAFDDVVDLDIVWYGDDWGTQYNLFMPPDIWRRTIKPHTARIYDCISGRGKIIKQHSCGRIESIFGDMVAMGAHVWDPCQPCNDLAYLKRQYGDRIAFWGGLDSQFVLGRPGVTAWEVRDEVKQRIGELAPGGGYVAAPSHQVPYSPAVMQAMNEAIATYGREIYHP